MSYIATLDNRTPFEALQLLLPDGQGGEAVLVVLKASFDLGVGTEENPELAGLALSSSPAAIRMVDEYIGDPAAGIVLADTDLALYKPRVDLVLVDPVAHAPRGQPAPQLFAELHVGHADGADSSKAAHDASQAQLIKSVLVSGDRVFVEDAPSQPLPFVTMPLDWYRTYGGTASTKILDARNPVGIGYAGARSLNPELLGEVPNVEHPNAPMVRRDTQCAPIGFGVVPRGWLPRRALAGSFDDTWKRSRWPLAPLDSDPGFHQCVQPDQQIARYFGGEPVRLLNLSPEGELLFRLPHLDVPVHLAFLDRLERTALRVDTVEIEVAARRVTLTARVAIPLARKRGALETIVLGHLKPGWARARSSGKCYLDLQGHAGTDPSRPWYW